jgi:uncharacterized OsmC-like protein
MEDEHSFKAEIKQDRDFSFNVKFGLENVSDLLMDEPKPLGEGKGPNATRVFAAALGNCLCASLLFCLTKSRVDVLQLDATVMGSWKRNDEGRWRIEEIDVIIEPKVQSEHLRQLERCIEIFEQFCVVSQSIREGVKINLDIKR